MMKPTTWNLSHIDLGLPQACRESEAAQAYPMLLSKPGI